MREVSARDPASAEGAVHVERRRSSRAPVTVRVQYSTVDALFSDFTRDINEGGIFVVTDQPLEPGTEIALQFHLPGTEEVVRARGRVVHVHGGSSGHPAGMGIRFEHLDVDARKRINALVTRLRVTG